MTSHQNNISITITEINKNPIIENKKPEPLFLEKNDIIKCLYCKKEQDKCEFSDTYCYDCGHCSCEYVCLNCHCHSYRCIEKCSDPDPVTVQNNYKTFTGGHFMEKNENGIYSHHCLCDCIKSSKINNFFPIKNTTPDEYVNNWENVEENISNPSIKSIDEYNINTIDDMVLNNYVLDNIDNMSEDMINNFFNTE